MWFQPLVLLDSLQYFCLYVLLNGVPGSWINYCKGLRQDNPLPPYIFIIVFGPVLPSRSHNPVYIN
jgi:hypothetical protein